MQILPLTRGQTTTMVILGIYPAGADVRSRFFHLPMIGSTLIAQVIEES